MSVDSFASSVPVGPCLIDSGAWDEVRFPLVTVLVLLYVVMLQK